MPAVEGHYAQLVELFTELITSAIKFRGEERLQVRVTAVQVGDGGLFLVANSGAGIEKAKWDDVFLRFEPGLGLALGKRIVANHNGRIRLESIPNVGTTVRFTILRSPARSPSGRSLRARSPRHRRVRRVTEFGERPFWYPLS